MGLRNRFTTGENERAQQTVFGVRKETVEGIAWSLPYLAVFSVFLVWPALKGFYMSLHNWDPFVPSESEFIGLDNYIALFNDPVFWDAMKGTIYFVVLSVPLLVLIGLGLALGVNKNVKGKRVLRAIYFSPYILTVAVVTLIWAEVYSEGYGLINYYLGFVMSNPPGWLTSTSLAMPALAFMTVWWLVGFNFVIFLAARQGVPERLYEAARLDGASTWRAFKDVTLPQMRNSILFVVIIQFILQFQVFAQPFVLTSGGPRGSTDTLVYYLYRSAFSQHQYGYGAAIGYVLVMILVVIAIINFKVIGTND
ncbi:binding-protein-dependent transport systems inner membrane component (plasmid) [Haloterrigena turkmenica DSM 5511]|uniref:Binding-protein-dependent transport systems inner membrane component n=1 Tax=Haloterrigena turkmenica (strain ATCC 51198 / DSM 5511 / JCM 9101 / NCIMB 13204 / VKM B-1734 / 4k) TaxID=543526 RepID=D2S1Q3_HALTV|nr:sugar ABC transporter permease [Haloterrigena turkmenica]ADB63300.1 binding-protein-dependent transport systems inner membrane component [Haloterrigena turkmenica DSM 5511]